MGDTLREYSGLLSFGSLADAVREDILSVGERYGLNLDLAESYLEFSFRGRNSNRFVERFLVELATLLVDADGEITCEQESDGVRSFEFYSVAGGELFRQVGHLERGPKEPVRSADSTAEAAT